MPSTVVTSSSSDPGVAARFLESVHAESLRVSNQIDSQLSIILGLSSALFAFSAERIGSGGSLFFLPLVIGAGGAAIIVLYAIHPTRGSSRHVRRDSIFVSRRAASFPTDDAYIDELTSISQDRVRIATEYARDTYNIMRFYSRPKRTLFHAARNILLSGVATSLVTFLFSLALSV